MSPSYKYHEHDYEFANTFATLRNALGLSQQSVATLLGVSSKAVENWEQGLTNLRTAYLKQFIVLCVQSSAFAVGHEAEQIRAFWHAAQRKVQLDEYWLSELLSPPASSPALAGEQLFAASQDIERSSEELPLWTVPHARNPHFTGRDELLSQLEQQFAQRAADPSTTIHQATLTQSQAIKGLGGIGKTQIAIEYAYRAHEQGRYTHILWISAASEEAILASFAALKDLVPVPDQKEESDQRALASRVLRWLELRLEPWLLIYDNADDMAFLPAYLPIQGQGSILFTTRSSAVSALAPSLEVDVLPLEEGVQLLLRRAGRAGEITEREREDASAIAQALGRFPLAIDQAGAYLEETGCRLADYLHIYQQHQYKLLARRGRQAGGYPDSVATTWSLAFERIEKQNPAAADLLRLCAFVAPDRLPEELLSEGAAFWPAALQEAVTDRLRFNQMLAILLDFSLVKRVGREQQLSLHRLVQAVQQARMTPEEQRQWAQRFVLAVQAVFPREAAALASWQRCERLLPQALACEALIEQYQLQQVEVATLLNRTGCYLDERGLYRQAEPLVRRALGIREQLLGSEHPDVAEVLNNLAILLWEQGNDAQGESLYCRALRIYEQQLEPQHLDVAQVLNNLGMLYTYQGKYAQAEPLLQRARHIWEERLGSEHPTFAISLNNLGLLYTHQEKYVQAELLHRQTLHIREQLLGSEHPDVAQSLNNLGFLYLHQGKYAQAEPLLQRAQRIWEEHLGPEHTHVASSLNNLATLYTRQGKYAQAEPLYQRALNIREPLLGPGHLETAKVLHAYAHLQQMQGRTGEAASMYQRALTAREHILGPDHPLTLSTRACLQEVLQIAPGQTREE